MSPRLGRWGWWLLAAAVLAGRVVQVRTSAVWGDDLMVFWRAGRAAADGANPWVPGYDYLPAALIVLAPLGLLSFRVARELWLVGGCVCVAMTTAFLARRLGLPPAGSVVCAFLAFPTVSALQFANVTLVELPVVALLAAAVGAGRWRRAAVLLVVGIAVKPVLVPCLVVLVRRRRWRELAGVLGGLVVLDALVLAVVGDAGGWLRQARSGLAGARQDPASADLGSLAGRLHLPGPVELACAAFVVALTLVVLWRTTDAVVLVSLPLIAAFLVGPVAWAHYPLLLLPLVGWLVARGGRAGRGLAALALVLSMSLEPVSGHLIRTVPPAGLFGLLTAALVVLLAAAALGTPGRARVRAAAAVT